MTTTELVLPAPSEVKYSPSREEIAVMKSKAVELLEQDANVPEVYESIRVAIREAVSSRTGIDKHRLRLTERARDFQREINNQAKEATALIEEIELPLKKKKQAIDDEKTRIALAKAEAIEREQKRVAAEHVARLEAEAKALRDAEAARLKAEQNAEDARRKVEQETERQRMAEERAKIEADRKAFQQRQAAVEEQQRKAKEEQEKAEREYRASLEDERMKMSEISGIQQQVAIAQVGRSGVRTGGTIECIEQTLAETEKWEISQERFGAMYQPALRAKEVACMQIRAMLKQAQENQRLKAERDATDKAQREAQAKIDEARRALEAEQAKVRHEAEIKAAEEKAKREAEVEAERKFAAAEKAKAEAAERERVAAADRAAKAPDRQKIKALVQSLLAIQCPDMKTKEGKAVAVQLIASVKTACSEASKFNVGA